MCAARGRTASPVLQKMSRRSFLSGVGHLSATFSAMALAGSAAGLSLASCRRSDSLLEQAGVSSDSLRVGLDFSRPPFEALVDAATPGAVELDGEEDYGAGFNVAVLEKVSGVLGVPVHFVDIPLVSLSSCLEKGYIDVVASSFFNGNDGGPLSYSDPYSSYDLAVVCRADSAYADARTVADLAGARMGTRDSSDLERVVQKLPGVVEMVVPGRRSEPLSMVQAGELDATVVARRSFESVDADLPDLVCAPIPSSELCADETGLRMAVRNEDAELLGLLNGALGGLGDAELDEMWSDAVVLWKDAATSYI